MNILFINSNKHLPSAALFAVWIFMAGCGRGGDSGGNTEAADLPVDTSAQRSGSPAPQAQASRRYGIRACVINSIIVTANPESRTEIVHYIDNFGNLEARATTLLVAGSRKPARGKTILREGTLYTLNVAEKTFTKMSADDPRNTEIDFSRIGQGVMRDVKAVETGRDTVLGLPCVEYAVTAPMRGLSGKFLVWNRIPLEAEYSVGDYRIRLTTESVKENATPPRGAFDIPLDYVLQTPSAPSVPGRPF